jgi:hypothetical protein
VAVCGWLGNEDLWGGGVTDTDYNEQSGYLQEQDEFQKADLVRGEIIEFLNMLE